MNASVATDAEHTVSMGVLNAIVQIVDNMSIATREQVLRAVGLAQQQLDATESRVPEIMAQRLCEVVLELSGDEALGLHWGERLGIGSFAPVSYLVAHADTLRTGLHSLTQFQTLLSDQPGYEIVEGPERVTMRCLLRPEHSPRLRRCMAELSVSGFVHIMRDFCPEWQPDEGICFEHAAPAYSAEYTRVFGGAERFDQPFTGFSFPTSLLDAASRHKDDGLHNAIRELAEQRLTRAVQSAPYTLRVRQHLVERGRVAERDMPSVARALGMSVRSLRRRLAAEGKSYAEVESEAFAIMARRLLVDRALTIQQAAFELGFRSTTSFHRAFKRSTGMTPNEFRDAKLGSRRA